MKHTTDGSSYRYDGHGAVKKDPTGRKIYMDIDFPEKHKKPSLAIVVVIVVVVVTIVVVTLWLA